MKEPKKKSTEEVLKEKLFEMTELWEVAKERDFKNLKLDFRVR